MDSPTGHAPNNVWLLFKGDLHRLRRNVVTIIAVAGLIVLPSLFSWYNVLACWSVFDNTGNLTVAVANSDEGYKSDLVPLRINIGDEVVSALRANDQLNWVITNEDDAIDGTRSGRYYAAVVIPASFSADMMSFYSDDMEHAKITYYSNQKKSAIAPKVTDQGADQVSRQVNEVFAETISEVALGIASALYDYADEADVNSSIGQLADRVGQTGTKLREAAQALKAYSKMLESSQALVDESATLLAHTQQSSNALAASTQGVRNSANTIVAAMSDSTAALIAAIEQSAAQYGLVSTRIDEVFSSSAAAAASASQLLRDQASLAQLAGDGERAQALRSAADDIDAKSAATQASRTEADALAAQARASLDAARTDFGQDLKPTLDQLATVSANASETVRTAANLLDSAGSELSGASGSISQELIGTRAKIDAAASELATSADTLETLSQNITSALATNDLEALRNVIGSDPSKLAQALAAPVQLERHAVYPVENFGSAMSPLYTTLALWIGALLIMVTLKLIPSAETLRELNNPSPRQVFVGRFGVVALISLAQSSFMSLGNLLFLGVQAVHPFLYMLCFWISGLTFAFIIYALVALFANLGKALAVVLLIVQVSGGGGSFPLQLLPQFFQNVSPYLPITHAVNAMRAAMFGIYQGDFWIQLGTLVLFAVPIALLALLLYKPLSTLVPRFVERVEASKLM